MKNVAVTGGAGFIGSALVRGLLADGVERVVVVDNLLSGKKENLEGVSGRVELVEGDVRDRAALVEAFSGVDTVFHEAAIASVPRSIDEPELCHEINVDGVFNALFAAKKNGVGRFVFAASSAAYGDGPGLAKHEEMPPAPVSPYGVHKVVGELYLKSFFDSFGLETVALRYFNVFGPRQDPSSVYSGVLSIFIDRLLAGEAPLIYGDGEQTRDFIFVEDIVRLNLLAAKIPAAAGRLYNGGRGESVSINRIWELLQQAAGERINARREPARPGDARHSCADISRARRELGFEPTVSLEKGLRRTLEWAKTVSREP